MLTICSRLATSGITSNAVGIDFGSSTICVSVVRGGRVEIIPNAAQNHLTPNIVTFLSGQDVLFGQPAKDIFVEKLRSSISGINAYIGRTFDEVLNNQLDDSVNISEDAVGKPEILLENGKWNRTVTVDEVLVLWFEHIKTSVDSYLQTSGSAVTDVVLTIPAQFDTNSRRQLTMAAETAKFNVLDVITGSVAAGIAYAIHSQIDLRQFPDEIVLPIEQNIVVIDIGYTSCEVAILSVDEDMLRVESSVSYSCLEDKPSDRFGGQGFDDNVLQYVLQVINNRYSIDAADDPATIARLQLACESAKVELSRFEEATIQLIGLPENDDIDFRTTITRSQFEDLNDCFRQVLSPLEEALRDAKLEKADIQNYVIVGGCSVIPKLQEVLKLFFHGRDGIYPLFPTEVISAGAAIRAAMIRPCDVDSTINLLVLDRAPMSLGVETVGGHMAHVVPRNTIYPTRKSVIFKPYKRSQSGVFLKIYEGEMSTVADNKLIGKFGLKFHPVKASELPNGIRQLEVTFDIDTRRMLKVSVTDKVTGNAKAISISSHNININSVLEDHMEAQFDKYQLSSV